ncbi:MAG: hypothetical protein HC898_10040 [Phycisphaerales bacterium]|nr:hypothetical protein [Phycisphaerales bacterium]
MAGKLGIPLSEAIELRRRLMRQGAAGEGEQPLFGSSRRESIDRAVFEALRPLYSELATEVGLCLRYYSVTFRGRRPECVQLTGGEAGDPFLAKALEEELKISAIPAQPLIHTDLAEQNLLHEDQYGHPAGWTAAVGLSMRGKATSGALRGAA